MQKILFFLFVFVVQCFVAQSSPTSSENYILSTTYLSADLSKKTETIQYFDGLGRPKQVVSVKATSTGKDLVVPVEYDAFGRASKDILPIPMSTGNGAIHTSASESTANSYYGVINAFSEKKIEQSPLARVTEVAHPGNEWAMGTAHTQKILYDINIPSDGVKKYSTTTTWSGGIADNSIPTIIDYPEKVLSKTTAIDEDGKTSVEFKNSLGQTVLSRKLSGSNPLDTYYVYNVYNQLVYVISPKATQQINSNNTITQEILDKLCYQYKYDNKSRTVEKKLPGKGWEFFVYDAQNRVVASQNAVQNQTNTWFFTRYDQFGRSVYTGQFSGGTRQQEQSNAIAKAMNNESRSTSSFTANTQEIFYTNAAYPSGSITVLSINYYDEYPGTNPNNTLPMPTTILTQPTLTGSGTFTVNGVNSIRSLKTLPTASLVKNLNDDNWTSTHIWYDVKLRPIGTQTKNHLGGYTKTESQLEFSGAVLFSNTYQKRLASDASETSVQQRFEYDDQYRVLKNYHKVNSNAEILLSEYTYNELGQVSNKKVGNNLQSIDYQYNIRGWKTKVNDPQNLGTKLFGYELKYTETSDALASTANYNGNIAEVRWKSKNDNVEKKYNYQYDNYNRLVAGIYAEPNTSLPTNGYFNENYSFDANGNISTLQRNGKLGSTTVQQIDNLTYTYDGNKLNTVTDSSQNYAGYPDTSGSLITYDSNGNMTNQADKGIQQIVYNALNLPNTITYNEQYYTRGVWQNSNTKYFYKADGTKLRREYRYSENSAYRRKVTEYLEGFQYEIISNGEDPTLKFVPTAEGYYDFVENRYIYNYVDHLGNVRVSYFSGSNGAEIIEENNYYPFGLKQENNNPNSTYQYKYNGKELQIDSGMLDYGARFYMPEIGRWSTVDPLAEQSRRWSPYTYGNDNPVRFIDPDGRTSWDVNGDGSNMYYDGQDAIDMFNSLNDSFQFPKFDFNLRTNSLVDENGQGGGGEMHQEGHLKQWFENAGVKYDDIPNMTINQVLKLIKKVPELAYFYSESGSFEIGINRRVKYSETKGNTNTRFGKMIFGTDAFNSMLSLGSTIIHETGHAWDLYTGYYLKYNHLSNENGFRTDIMEYRNYTFELKYSLPQYNSSGLEYRNTYYKRIFEESHQDPDSFLNW